MPFKDVKREILDEFERRYLLNLLERHDCNLSAAERASGLSRRHLRALIRKHGLYERVLRARIRSIARDLPLNDDDDPALAVMAAMPALEEMP